MQNAKCIMHNYLKNRRGGYYLSVFYLPLRGVGPRSGGRVFFKKGPLVKGGCHAFKNSCVTGDSFKPPLLGEVDFSAACRRKRRKGGNGFAERRGRRSYRNAEMFIKTIWGRILSARFVIGRSYNPSVSFADSSLVRWSLPSGFLVIPLSSRLRRATFCSAADGNPSVCFADISPNRGVSSGKANAQPESFFCGGVC